MGSNYIKMSILRGYILINPSMIRIMGIREIFAQNLKAARKAKGLSQEELAHRAGIDRTYVGALERCRYAVSIDVADRLAVVLETEAWRLLRTTAPSRSSIGERAP